MKVMIWNLIGLNYSYLSLYSNNNLNIDSVILFDNDGLNIDWWKLDILKRCLKDINQIFCMFINKIIRLFSIL